MYKALCTIWEPLVVNVWDWARERLHAKHVCSAIELWPLFPHINCVQKRMHFCGSLSKFLSEDEVSNSTFCLWSETLRIPQSSIFSIFQAELEGANNFSPSEHLYDDMGESGGGRYQDTIEMHHWNETCPTLFWASSQLVISECCAESTAETVHPSSQLLHVLPSFYNSKGGVYKH